MICSFFFSVKKVNTFLVVMALSSTAFAANKIAKAQIIAAEANCEIAVGLENSDKFICIGNRITNPGTYKQLTGCALSLISPNDGLVRLNSIGNSANPELNTNIIQIKERCDAESLNVLMKMPISETEIVEDLVRVFVASGPAPVILVETIPFQEYLKPSIMMSRSAEPEAVEVSDAPEERGELLTNKKTKLKMSQKSKAITKSSATSDQALGYSTVKVFYGTDRKLQIKNSEIKYLSERSPVGIMSVGIAEVTIPKVHAVGELEEPSVFNLEFSQNPEKHVILKSVSKMRASDFYKDIRNKVASSAQKDLFVFIHGYNVTFENAVRRTAQIAYDLNFAGAPLVFSWPSDGTLKGYFYDEINVEWAVPHLIQFLQNAVTQSGATKVHLIAHSMGNRAMTKALAALSQSKVMAQKSFHQIIMAAPDMNAAVYTKVAEKIKAASDRVTLYYSNTDRALQLSQLVHGDRRLGLSPYLVKGVDTIDASDVDTSLFALDHSYFSDEASMLLDIKVLIKRALPPSDRKYLRLLWSGSAQYWEFPGY